MLLVPIIAHRTTSF